MMMTTKYLQEALDTREELLSTAKIVKITGMTQEMLRQAAVISNILAKARTEVYEFNEYFVGYDQFDLEIEQEPLLKCSVPQELLSKLEINVSEIKIFGKSSSIVKEQHDFILQMTFFDGTYLAMGQMFHENSDIEYNVGELNASVATKAIASLVLMASDYDIPGFVVWYEFAKGPLAKALPIDEQDKLFRILNIY